MVCCECKEFSLVVSIFSIYSMKVLGLGTNGSNMVLNLHWLVERCLQNNSWHLNRSIPIGFPFCISYPLCDINERVRWRTSLIAECCSIGWRCCQTGTKYSLQNPNRKTTRLCITIQISFSHSTLSIFITVLRFQHTWLSFSFFSLLFLVVCVLLSLHPAVSLGRICHLERLKQTFKHQSVSHLYTHKYHDTNTLHSTQLHSA